jgi:hypothetical protein
MRLRPVSGSEVMASSGQINSHMLHVCLSIRSAATLLRPAACISIERSKNPESSSRHRRVISRLASHSPQSWPLAQALPGISPSFANRHGPQMTQAASSQEGTLGLTEKLSDDEAALSLLSRHGRGLRLRDAKGIRGLEEPGRLKEIVLAAVL